MEVDFSAVKLASASTSSTTMRSWMLGQLLDAIVIGRDSENSIRLRLAGTNVRASTALPLRAGDNLQLKVAQLKPIATLTVASPLPSLERSLIPTAIGRVLPI